MQISVPQKEKEYPHPLISLRRQMPESRCIIHMRRQSIKRAKDYEISIIE
jgi:hypothetical protein